jgi:ribose transport system substrate-binding protein
MHQVPHGQERGRRRIHDALAGAQSLNDRDKGFVDELKKYPGLKIADHRVGNNDPARALSDAEDILMRHPHLNGIFADNELEGDGAGRAIQEKNLGREMCAVAFDTSDQEVAFVRDGILDGLIVQNPYMMGYPGVWYALAAANGAVLPHTVDSGVYVVTKANIDSPQMAGLLNPKKYQVSPYLGG